MALLFPSGLIWLRGGQHSLMHNCRFLQVPIRNYVNYETRKQFMIQQPKRYTSEQQTESDKEPSFSEMKESFEAAQLSQIQQQEGKYKTPSGIITAEEIEQRQQRCEEQLGFSKVELKYVLKHKPALFKYDEDGTQGLAALEKLFIGKLGYDAELLRTFIVKYPPILSKDTSRIEETFQILGNEGFDQ